MLDNPHPVLPNGVGSTDSPVAQPHRQFDHDHIIQLHAAEYAALTTRITYIDLFCASVWGLIVAFITIVANSWDRIAANGVLVWASVIGIQLMLTVISTFLGDHYTIVLYLETELHRLITDSGIDVEFWNWEKFLAGRRRTAASTPWEWVVPPAAAVPIALAVWSRWQRWQRWDYLGVVLSAAVLPMLILHTAHLVKTREDWTKAVNDRARVSPSD